MNDGENARWDMAIALADELTPHARTEGRKNAYVFLLNGSVTKKYMCLDLDKNCPAPNSMITELKK